MVDFLKVVFGKGENRLEQFKRYQGNFVFRGNYIFLVKMPDLE